MGAAAHWNPIEGAQQLREAWGEGVTAASGKGSGTGMYKWAKFLKPIWGATGRAAFEQQKSLIGKAYSGNVAAAAQVGLAGVGPGTYTGSGPAKKKKSSTLIGG